MKWHLNFLLFSFIISLFFFFFSSKVSHCLLCTISVKNDFSLNSIWARWANTSRWANDKKQSKCIYQKLLVFQSTCVIIIFLNVDDVLFVVVRRYAMFLFLFCFKFGYAFKWNENSYDLAPKTIFRWIETCMCVCVCVGIDLILRISLWTFTSIMFTLCVCQH